MDLYRADAAQPAIVRFRMGRTRLFAAGHSRTMPSRPQEEDHHT